MGRVVRRFGVRGLIRLQQVSKVFVAGGREIRAVAPTTLDVATGEALAVMGSSGAGKSTLLRLINRLEEPTAGRVLVDDLDITALDAAGLRRARRSLGMIFQGFNLLANRTVLGNVAFPLEVAGASRAEATRRALECLELVGLADRADHYPAQLSGGQKQRVAIARAIAPRPTALLCDEPTSALDPDTTVSVLDTLHAIHRELGVTLVVVTHAMDVARRLCNRVVVMEHGEVVDRLDLRAGEGAVVSSIARRLTAARLSDAPLSDAPLPAGRFAHG